ncbi:MAG TPA: CHASE3 domain-containing protein [Opitutaceae bacterium]|nr:CHASE3 domain-containing protein [Opitutaceae bacterium]
MKDKTIRRVLFFFLLISAVLVAVAVRAVVNINRSMASSDWVNHTHSVILELEGLRADLVFGDGALHTFVLTGDARDQAAIRAALNSVSDHVDIAKALTRGEPAQNAEVAELETLVDKQGAFMRDVLAAKQGGNADALRALLAADAGRAAIQEINQKIKKLKDEEMALLTERDTASYLQAQTTRWTVWSGVVLDVLLLGGVAWLIRDDIAARQKAAIALQAANEQLEQRVKERTAELVAANAKLSSENLERRWANQAMEHQLRYNNLIINSITDLVFVITKPLNISRINPAVSRQTGFDLSEIVDLPLKKVVRLTATGGDAMFDPVARALNDGRDLQDQPALLVDKRDRTIPVRFNLFPLRDRDKIVGGVVILQLSPTPRA